MARVDLQCPCGYMFFVGDAQLNQKGGVKCPSCMAPVKVPAGGASGAKPAAAKPAPRPAAPPAYPPAAASGAGSRMKLYIIGGSVAAAVVAILVGLVLFLRTPGVDLEKQAEMQEQARKRAFEEISSKAGPSKAPAFAPASSSQAPPSSSKTPMPPAVRPATVEVKPATPVAPSPATPQSTTPAKAPGTVVALSVEAINKVRADVLPLHPYYLGLVLSPAEKARADGISSLGRGVPEDADFLQSILAGGKLKAVRDEIGLIAQTLPTLERESQENLPVDKVTLVEGGRILNCKILDEGAEIVKVSRTLSSGVGGIMPLRRDNISRIEKGKGIGTEFAAQWESAQKGSLAAQVGLLVWCKENNLAGQAKLVAFTIVKADPSNTQARAEAGLPADPVKNSEEVAKGGVIAYQGKNWIAKELKEKFLRDGYCLLEGKWYSKKDKMVVVPGLFRYERQQDKPVNIGGTAQMCHDTEMVYKQLQDANTGQMIEQVEQKLLRRFYAPEMVVKLTGTLPPGVAPPVSTYDMDIRLNCDEGSPPAGTAMKGEVTINVPLGVPILEASVITIAEVKAGGSINVYFTTGSGENEKRTKLYSCDPKEGQSHTIPAELVRGLTEVNLVAVVEEIAAYIPKVERRHVRAAVKQGKILVSPAVDIIHHRQIPDYKAVLFPSGSNTIEVFRLKLSLADPSPQIDKLFAGNPDVLR
jgi:hypothetical protein